MNTTKHIVSFSGGKDSTAMLLMMLEKNMQVDDILFADTGKDFPQMYEHIKKVENYINKNIIIVKAKHSFDYYLGDIERKNKLKYKHNGRGWADMMIIWCTSELIKYQQTRPIEIHLKNSKPYVQYVGIAYDQRHRAEKYKTRQIIKYPLIDWGITEKEALEYCYSHGFDWGGLYDKFKRLSCYCCPLQSINELRVVYKEFPELWADMLEMDKKSWRSFRSDYTLTQLNDKFRSEINL